MAYMSNGVTHYNYGGNVYYEIAPTGFCGAKTGSFTVARADITCADCRAEVASLDAWCNA